jgi:hypothetical protein
LLYNMGPYSAQNLAGRAALTLDARDALTLR